MEEETTVMTKMQLLCVQVTFKFIPFLRRMNHSHATAQNKNINVALAVPSVAGIEVRVVALYD